MAETETWTIGRLLNWTTDHFAKQQADTPRLDAEVLLAEARRCRRIELYTAFEEPASEQVRTAFRELVRRRSEGTPVAYLVGRKEFYSLEFRVSPDVLIPRPETEHLVLTLLDLVKAHPDDGRELQAIDVGTGSGCVAIAALRQSPRLRFAAVDASPAAAEIAGYNADKLEVADRLQIAIGDLLGDFAGPFDFVVSNPPYVTSTEYEELAPEVRDHEPRLALEAGPHGTDVIARLIPQAAERLHPGGYLLLEISPMLEGRVCELIAADRRFEPAVSIKDLAGHVRVLQARKL